MVRHLFSPRFAEAIANSGLRLHLDIARQLGSAAALEDSELRAGLQQMLTRGLYRVPSARCAYEAQRHFSLEQDVERHRAVYEAAAGPG